MPVALRSNGEVPGRNAAFSLLAAMAASEEGVAGGLSVVVGIHGGTEYYDCGVRFVDDMQRLFDGYWSGAVALYAPFVGLTKGDVIQMARELRVPMELTYSCMMQEDVPCECCSSCLDRRRWFDEHANLHDDGWAP